MSGGTSQRQASLFHSCQIWLCRCPFPGEISLQIWHVRYLDSGSGFLFVYACPPVKSPSLRLWSDGGWRRRQQNRPGKDPRRFLRRSICRSAWGASERQRPGSSGGEQFRQRIQPGKELHRRPDWHWGPCDLLRFSLQRRWLGRCPLWRRGAPGQGQGDRSRTTPLCVIFPFHEFTTDDQRLPFTCR